MPKKTRVRRSARPANPVLKKISPLLRITPRFSPIEAIEHQRLLLRRKDYEIIGSLQQITFGDGCFGSTYDANPMLRRASPNGTPLPPMFDWCKTGTMIARAKIAGAAFDEYLIVGKLPHPPDLPDPAWEKPDIYKSDGSCILEYEYKDGLPFPKNMPRPRMIRQSLLNCAYVPEGVRWEQRDGKWMPTEGLYHAGRNGELWMVFQDVTQVIFDPFDGVFGVISAQEDKHGNRGDKNGCLWTFLYEPRLEEGHLIYGRQQANSYS
jgi:hypothetical protein